MHDQVGTAIEKGFEKRKAHKVVPMGVGKKEMIGEPFFFEQAVAQAANSGTGINDNDLVLGAADLKAGGVTAVFEILTA